MIECGDGQAVCYDGVEAVIFLEATGLFWVAIDMHNLINSHSLTFAPRCGPNVEQFAKLFHELRHA